MYVCLPSMNAMYFSILLGMQFISKLLLFPIEPISCIIKWESYPRRIWKMTGILNSFGLILSFRLQFWCADPLYCPVIWQWSRTLISLSLYHVYWCPQIWYTLATLNFCSSTSVICKGLFNLVLIIFWQYCTSERICGINFLVESSPL